MKKVVYFGIWLIFGIYCLFLIYFVFLRNITTAPSDNLLEHMKYRVNLIPFRTIGDYCSRVISGSINFDLVLVKILGDLISLIPMGIFIGLLFSKINTLFKAFLLGVVVVLFLEIVQLLTMTGSFDVDNFILMIPGFMFGYIVSKTLLKCILKKLGG